MTGDGILQAALEREIGRLTIKSLAMAVQLDAAGMEIERLRALLPKEEKPAGDPMKPKPGDPPIVQAIKTKAANGKGDHDGTASP